MRDAKTQQHRPDSPAGARHAPLPSAPAQLAPLAAGALALQRAAGNRAATRVLSRWQAHPDKEKKGMLVPDVVAADFAHFNPPANS